MIYAKNYITQIASKSVDFFAVKIIKYRKTDFEKNVRKTCNLFF